ncbi:chromosome partitioning protein, ParB family [Ferrithrix thermotolerans DSM 19514]|jgi:ParB family chromosome partitioning protein|uniref:Chromosome partitioning protein, ParB family n=1 Tax=Ferrithrix thermotolerans DSM 19514 TaxID=1121881 RepID=A0A1M4XSX4_9ACTN|nr:ParB/RepB/Spo0J family partition protein [Ferrithrix thermotolerans]SHE96694.1 chromosome partitioning protein, ParB family [Ferrithrix thermotolerans DSM 19514]
MARVSGLGRGLSSLIPVDGNSDADSSLQNILISAIVPNRFQPRRVFDEESIASLAESIATIGVLQPVLVRRLDDTSYELIAGERRLRAARRAGLDRIPAVVQSAKDQESLERAIVENLHRADLNPLEEAGAYKQLIDDFNLTQEEVAKRVGKSRVAITNTLRMLQLPPAIQRMVGAGEISAGHARAILGIPDQRKQVELAEEVVKSDMSVRQVEERVRLLKEEVPETTGLLSKANAKTVERPSQADKSAGVVELENLLREHLDTEVVVTLGQVSSSGIQGGRIQISFGSIEDLERIFRTILH